MSKRKQDDPRTGFVSTPDVKSATNDLSNVTLILNDKAPSNPWSVIEYEVAMFQATREILRNLQQPLALNNAVTESFLLHIRNLCEFALRTKRQKEQYPDDIGFVDLFSGWENDARYDSLRKSIHGLGNAYGTNDQDSPRAALNQRLAHPTQKRAESAGYDYTRHVKTVAPFIERIIEQIEILRGVPFLNS